MTDTTTPEPAPPEPEEEPEPATTDAALPEPAQEDVVDQQRSGMPLAPDDRLTYQKQ